MATTATDDACVPDHARAGPPARRARRTGESDSGWRHWRLAATSAVCWAFLVLAFALGRLADLPGAGISGLYLIAYIFGGSFATLETIDGLRHGRVGIDLLMVTAATGAAAIGAWAEGGVLLGLFSASNALEYHALGRTRSSVRALMDLSPQEATVLRSGSGTGEATIPLEALTMDDALLVRPGERFATDGIVAAGETSADQSAITGESMPVTKRPGDQIFAGTINGQEPRRCCGVPERRSS
jgi:Cd2+/Zn2+-exporting ATPase